MHHRADKESVRDNVDKGCEAFVLARWESNGHFQEGKRGVDEFVGKVSLSALLRLRHYKTGCCSRKGRQSVLSVVESCSISAVHLHL